MGMLKKKGLFFLLGLLILFVAGVGIRREVLLTQYEAQGKKLSFTLESALEFRRIQQVFDTGRLPEIDKAVRYPQGINVRATDTVGSEYVYAALARLFPSSVPLQDRIRWIELIWFCLGIPFLALWIAWWTRSYWAGWFAGGFYAVSTAAVVRSTGQELSHENTALPFLAAHLAFDALAESTASRKLFWLGTLLSAACLGLAMTLWDMMQFFVLLWILVEWAREVFGAGVGDGRRFVKWLVQFAALLVVGAMNPYLKAHAFLASPAMLLGYGILLVRAMEHLLPRNTALSGVSALPKAGRDATPFASGKWANAVPRLIKAAMGLIPLLIGTVFMRLYSSSYGHFFELIVAKIRFLNVKPEDPALLTFAQRIMWVPSLHSATLDLTIRLFPVILLLTLAAFGILLIKSTRSNSNLFRLLFFYIASLIAYCMFVRFHVFLALFAAGVMGMFAAWGLEGKWLRKTLVLALTTVGLGAEAAQIIRHPELWGRPNVYYEEVEGLIQRLKESVAPEPVLANFGISSSILAYSGCPIILHPKFESADIRNLVQSYGEALFKGDEKKFAEWVRSHGARYYVYALGEFADVAPDQQMRYMVNCLYPPANAAARIFELYPEKSKAFKELWSNRKYRLLRVVSPDDPAQAERRAVAAEQALQEGRLNQAQREAVGALEFDPENRRAMEVLQHVGALKDQGFEYSGHEAD
jgi:hypothetical protein